MTHRSFGPDFDIENASRPSDASFKARRMATSEGCRLRGATAPPIVSTNVF